MSRNYKFHNPEGAYFVSFAVVEWLDVFSRNEYKEILLDSLRYCQKEKGMDNFAWCIMTNHVHLVFRTNGAWHPQVVLGDFKRYTSRGVSFKLYTIFSMNFLNQTYNGLPNLPRTHRLSQ